MVWSSSSLLLALEALFGFEESIEKGGSSKSSAASPGRVSGMSAVVARLDSLWAAPLSLWIGSRRLVLRRLADLPLAASSRKDGIDPAREASTGASLTRVASSGGAMSAGAGAVSSPSRWRRRPKRPQ